MNTRMIAPEIVEFARRVRESLADLPETERDELTDGLEADLAEAYAEDLSRELPDPVEYATELRNAAGLPASDADEKAGVLAGLGVWARRSRAGLADVVDRNPALTSTRDFAVSLRPFWWVVRAWIASWLVSAVLGFQYGVLPTSLGGLLILAAFALVSVQWGRGRWSFKGLAPVIVIGNVIALVLLVPVTAMASNYLNTGNVYSDGSDQAYLDDVYGGQDPTGVYLNGTQVTNIFPYDADGKPLKNVQLFDQDGNPLSTSVQGGNGCIDADCTQEGLWVPSLLSSGVSVFNVFPMSMVPASYDNGSGVLQAESGAEPMDRKAPFVTAPRVELPSGEQADETDKKASKND